MPGSSSPGESGEPEKVDLLPEWQGQEGCYAGITQAWSMRPSSVTFLGGSRESLTGESSYTAGSPRGRGESTEKLKQKP